MTVSQQTFTAATIQICASADLQSDIDRCIAGMEKAVERGAVLLTLPEVCVGLDQSGPRPKTIAFTEQEHPALPAFRQFAQYHKVEVLIGSIGIEEDKKIYNRSYLINSSGEISAHYDKIHLFDIDLGGDVWFRESDTFKAGERAVLASCMGSQAGMAICYDLRFPQLFRTYSQAGAKILFVPAAFTRPTGEAHWHSLLRARAIENAAWGIAPAQHGTATRGCYGHSLIVDPWGTIQAECGESEEIAIAEIDLDIADKTRAKIPAITLKKEFSLKNATV